MKKTHLVLLAAALAVAFCSPALGQGASRVQKENYGSGGGSSSGGSSTHDSTSMWGNWQRDINSCSTTCVNMNDHYAFQCQASVGRQATECWSRLRNATDACFNSCRVYHGYR